MRKKWINALVIVSILILPVAAPALYLYSCNRADFDKELLSVFRGRAAEYRIIRGSYRSFGCSLLLALGDRNVKDAVSWNGLKNFDCRLEAGGSCINETTYDKIKADIEDSGLADFDLESPQVHFYKGYDTAHHNYRLELAYDEVSNHAVINVSFPIG